MKRLIVLPLLTVLVMAFAAAACGAGGEDSGALRPSGVSRRAPGHPQRPVKRCLTSW